MRVGGTVSCVLMCCVVCAEVLRWRRPMVVRLAVVVEGAVVS